MALSPFVLGQFLNRVFLGKRLPGRKEPAKKYDPSIFYRIKKLKNILSHNQFSTSNTQWKREKCPKVLVSIWQQKIQYFSQNCLIHNFLNTAPILTKAGRSPVRELSIRAGFVKIGIRAILRKLWTKQTDIFFTDSISFRPITFLILFRFWQKLVPIEIRDWELSIGASFIRIWPILRKTNWYIFSTICPPPFVSPQGWVLKIGLTVMPISIGVHHVSQLPPFLSIGGIF